MMTAGRHALPQLASFWHSAELTWLETLCITSFLDCGHSFTLYAAGPVRGLPEGAELRHPSEILWPPAVPIGPEDRTAAAVFSDLFRLELLAKTGKIWVDLDAYCVRPLAFSSPWIFTMAPDGAFPTGILGLPAWSSVLARMREFVNRPSPTAPWRPRRGRRLDDERRAAGEIWTIYDLPWASSGPRALRHFMEASVERRNALPYAALYGLATDQLRQLHKPGLDPARIEGAGVHSVHIYGRQKKVLALRHGGLPVPRSYLDSLCRRHGVDPLAAPIRPMPWMRTPELTDAAG